MEFQAVKQEIAEEDTQSVQHRLIKQRFPASVAETAAKAGVLIELSDSSDDETDQTPATKKHKVNGPLQREFLEPVPALPESALLLPPPPRVAVASKQFWKAGDYEGSPCGGWDHSTGGMDHVRVHPKFLHSNATSHKWALGAFAELLDNSLDEVCYGATYVNIDMLINKKDGNEMLLIEDNGGGMDPEKMRQCMSLGYSAKSKLANTIGQYGNGFKTSTMRLGADVIVFSRCRGNNGRSVTQSIGLLSYTFLRSTGKEDIVVPILDYENRDKDWRKILRSSNEDWTRNVETIVKWSPYSSEAELLQQFNLMKDHGTRIVIYNLWEDDQGQLELDFKSDRHDIQIRGVNRDEKNIQMAQEYPNSKHFLTYRHSLRSYVSILYLRLPPGFRIILRGKDVEHHNIVNDMMMSEEVTYRPQPTADGVPRDTNMVAVVTIGFVKDARAHIDVQGFNVYHKNRLIKPFWRVWNAAGSDGRGVIGVLEANFVEPAHDKQGFERTTVLARLENKLVQMQKTYWSSQCHKIGYAPRRNKKQAELDRESSPEYTPSSSRAKSKSNTMNNGKSSSPASQKQVEKTAGKYASVNEKCGNGRSYHARNRASSEDPTSSSSEDTSYSNEQTRVLRRRVNGNTNLTSTTTRKAEAEAARPVQKGSAGTRHVQSTRPIQKVPPVREDCSVQEVSPVQEAQPVQEAPEVTHQDFSIEGVVESLDRSDMQVLDHLKEENRLLRERLAVKEVQILSNLQQELQLERDKCESLKTKLQEAELRIEDLNKEQESLIDIFSEERDRRDIEEENLRKRLREASDVIEELRERVRMLESKNSSNGRR